MLGINRVQRRILFLGWLGLIDIDRYLEQIEAEHGILMNISSIILLVLVVIFLSVLFLSVLFLLFIFSLFLLPSEGPIALVQPQGRGPVILLPGGGRHQEVVKAGSPAGTEHLVEAFLEGAGAGSGRALRARIKDVLEAEAHGLNGRHRHDCLLFHICLDPATASRVGRSLAC